jgi:hypothetical protein
MLKSMRPRTSAKPFGEVGKALEKTRRQFRNLQFAATDRDVIQEGLLAVYRQGKKRMKAAIDLGERRCVSSLAYSS